MYIADNTINNLSKIYGELAVEGTFVLPDARLVKENQELISKRFERATIILLKNQYEDEELKYRSSEILKDLKLENNIYI